MLCIKIFDGINNKPLKNAKVKIKKDDNNVAEGSTAPNGHCHFSTDFEPPFKVEVEATRDPLAKTEKSAKYDFDVREQQEEIRLAINFGDPSKSIVDLEGKKVKDGQSKADKVNDPNEPKHPENRPGGSVNHDPIDNQNDRDEPTAEVGTQDSNEESTTSSVTPTTGV